MSNDNFDGNYTLYLNFIYCRIAINIFTNALFTVYFWTEIRVRTGTENPRWFFGNGPKKKSSDYTGYR